MGLEKIPHHCGVMAVWGDVNAAEMVFHGLYSLQHRGQESSGIVSSDGDRFYRHAGMGVLTHVFDNHAKLEELKGRGPSHCSGTEGFVGHTGHSMSPELFQQIEALEEEIKKLKNELK